MLEKQCTDHLGNMFSSVKEMCKYWGVNSTTFNLSVPNAYIHKHNMLLNNTDYYKVS